MLPGWGIHLQKDTAKPRAWHHKHLINATKCHSISGKNMFSPTLYLWGEQITSARSTELTRARVKAGVLPHKACSCPGGAACSWHRSRTTDNCWLSPRRLIQVKLLLPVSMCPAHGQQETGERCFGLHFKAGRMKIHVQLKNLT